MSEQVTSKYGAVDADREPPGAWAVGLIVFAATMMILSGIFQAIAGLVAILENEVYVVAPNYLFEFDVTAWGWLHLVVGVVVALAGLAVLSGQTWGRVVGITLAMLSAIANFAFIPYYPFWSLLIIALDIFVIWALAARAGDLRS
jgi:hypothetical protein